MSVSLQPVDERSTDLLQHDQRDAPTHSPALTASPLPPSPSSAMSASSGPSSAPDAYSPFSLPAAAPASSPASSDGEELASRDSDAARLRIRSLITGVSTSLIASAVREKAYSDLARLEEIFASPAEQAHLTKQQKWKLALRQQRLKLYLQQPQLDAHEQPAEHDAAQSEQEAADGADATDGQQAAAAAAGGPSLTIFTTPPLHASLAPSLARELSSFSLYTPDSLNATMFNFAAAPPLGLRTPSAPAEAQYTVADDEPLQTESDDSSVLDDQHAAQHGAAPPSQPSTPTSSSSTSLPQHHHHRPPLPHRRPTSTTTTTTTTTTTATPSTNNRPQRTPPPLLTASIPPVQVSRSGRTIKRRFDVSSIGGRKTRRVVTAGGREAGGGVEEEPKVKVRVWERGYEEEEESGEEEEEVSDNECVGGAQEQSDYGVVYRQH